MEEEDEQSQATTESAAEQQNHDFITELTDDPTILKSMIDILKLKEMQSVKDKEELEEEFGRKRAKFMELFKQKEAEVCEEREAHLRCQTQRQELLDRVRALESELDECKCQVTISECTRENEVDEQKRKCTEEIASLQQIIKETLAEFERAKMEYEREIHKLRKVNAKSEVDIAQESSRAQASAESSKEGVLSAMTKTLVKRVPGLNAAYSQSNENLHENLEDSMKKAQEDAEVLRSLVVPLEEEIRALKEKLRAADDQLMSIQNMEGNKSTLDSSLDSSRLVPVSDELDDKLKGLHEGLQAEKSSRSDLEMYVAVLQSQKASLQNEAEDLKKQLREVCQILEKEKREHNDLKQTWQLANDQFLEVQRTHTDDMKRLTSVLTAEQQRTVAELKRDFARESTPFAIAAESIDSQSSSKRSSPVSFPSSPRRRKSPSPGRIGGSTLVEESGKKGEEFTFDVDKKETGRAFHESLSSNEGAEEQPKVLDGHRLISEKEWIQLQDELKWGQEKLNAPCDMCANYEAQLQKCQTKEKELLKKVKALEQSNEWHKADVLNEQQARKELEEKLLHCNEHMNRQLNDLYTQFGELERLEGELQSQFSTTCSQVNENLKLLSVDRETVQERLMRLERENDTLVGKYNSTAAQMQNEIIDLPSSPEGQQLLLLRLREELIMAKTAKEHVEETLRSEMLFMKERAEVEQNTRDETEAMLTQEIDALRQKVGILESVKLLYESEQQRRREMESNLQETQHKYADSQAKHRQLVSALQKQIEEGAKHKKKLEDDVAEFRLKVQTLQSDLDNSEAVQHDFVKLTQSLQVQLEKIRESEKEVRWQHEDDVNDCTHCKQPFNMTRRKRHCRHCGKIFCYDCTTHGVPSGPLKKDSKVCDVCHTLLMSQTAPYFSLEPPSTPD